MNYNQNCPSDDGGKNYTLTVYAAEDFKELYGGDTLVKNYATCQHLYNGGKHVIFTNSWEITRGGKTIATGDGINAFCRFITCEFDVSERLAEIADGKSVDLEICGEHVYFQNGKFIWVMSPKYHAGFHAEAGIDGNEHYEIFTADKNGKFTRGGFVTEEEFFIVMIERGGCTIDTNQPFVIYSIDVDITAPADDFDTQVANALKAKSDAKAVMDEKDAIVAKAKLDAKKACDVYEAAKAEVMRIYTSKADELTAEIRDISIDEGLYVTKQNGYGDVIHKGLFVYVCDVYDFDTHVTTYQFVIAQYDVWEGHRLGIYDTLAQIETVIDMLKAAIERGDNEFTFPTVDELSGTDTSILTA